MRSLRPEIKVLYMSGYTELSLLEGPMLAKPLTPAMLVQKVREVLDE
jgi:hypothetical protein